MSWVVSCITWESLAYLLVSLNKKEVEGRKTTTAIMKSKRNNKKKIQIEIELNTGTDICRYIQTYNFFPEDSEESFTMVTGIPCLNSRLKSFLA